MSRKGFFSFLILLFFAVPLLAKQVFKPDQEGFIHDWLICGPFPAEYKDGKCLGFDEDCLKDFGGEEGIEPFPGLKVKTLFPEVPPVERPFVGEANAWGFKENKLLENSWQPYHAPESKIDFLKVKFPLADNVAAYAACYIFAPEDKRIKIKLGSDDGYKVWLNGKFVGGLDICRGLKPDENMHLVKLKKGLNSLLVKITQGVGGFNFCLRLTDLKDKPMIDLTCHVDNPKIRYARTCKGLNKVNLFAEPYFGQASLGKEPVFTGKRKFSLSLGAIRPIQTSLRFNFISPRGKKLLAEKKEVNLRPEEAISFSYPVELLNRGDYTVLLSFGEENVYLEHKVSVLSPEYALQQLRETQSQLQRKGKRLTKEKNKLASLNQKKEYLKKEIEQIRAKAQKARENYLGVQRQKASKSYRLPEVKEYRPSPAIRTRICLNGIWERVGVKKMSLLPPSTGWKPMPVPLIIIPGCLGPDKKFRDHSDVSPSLLTHKGWHRLYFKVPDFFKGRRVFLKFDAINFYAKGYLNGTPLGEYYGPYFPWEIDITEMVKYGEDNELLLYVQSSVLTENYKDYQVEFKFLYYNGIWQDVWLETRGKVFADKVMIVPSVRNWTLTTRTFLVNNDTEPHKVKIIQRAIRKGKIEFELTSEEVFLKPGEKKILDNKGCWPNPALWGIGEEYGDPELYTLSTLIVEDNQILDEELERFGFREFWIEGFNFFLNGKKIFLQGTNGGCERDIQHSITNNSEWIRHLYRLLKEYNMNVYRLHVHIYPSLFYEIADEMGMLLVAENRLLDHHDKIWWKDHPKIWEENAQKNYKRWLKELYNHPSIILWSLDNEVCTQSGARYKTPEGQSRMKKLKEFGTYFKSIWPGNQIPDYNGDVFAWQDPDEPVANFHYPESGGAESVGLNLLTWQSWFKKPVIFGETAYYWSIGYPKRLGHYPDVVKAEAQMTRGYVRRWISLEIPGFFGWWHGGGGYEIAPGKAGPWDWKKGKFPYVNIEWPALSGRGARVSRMVVASGRYNINWFDPERPEYVPNEIDRTFKECLRPVPEVPSTFPPELIVELKVDGRPASGEYIYLKPPAKIPAYLEGIKADKEGKAWFLAPEKGNYELFFLRGKQKYSKPVTLKRIPNNGKPGYQDFNWLKWEVK